MKFTGVRILISRSILMKNQSSKTNHANLLEPGSIQTTRFFFICSYCFCHIRPKLKRENSKKCQNLTSGLPLDFAELRSDQRLVPFSLSLSLSVVPSKAMKHLRENIDSENRKRRRLRGETTQRTTA
jgi:hypothetical protein